MEFLGKFLLILSFSLTFFVAVSAIYAGITRKEKIKNLVFYAFHSVTIINTAISALLLYGILTNDFTNVYIASYTSQDLPLFYKITAFWAGEKGALLFWVLVLSILGSLVIIKNKNEEIRFISFSVSIISFVLLFFSFLIVFLENPFETFEGQRVLSDGFGLNPLLQNFFMAFHPPTQLAGFAGWAIPYAFAISSVLCRKKNSYWIEISRKWTILAWLLLTLGLLFGGLWAYLELGWGGFWGWDPVENAALLPWLIASAFIHSAIVEKKKRNFKKMEYLFNNIDFFAYNFCNFSYTQSINKLSTCIFRISSCRIFFLFHAHYSLFFFFYPNCPQKGLSNTGKTHFFFFQRNIFFLK